MEVKLNWNRKQLLKRKKLFAEAQNFVDSQCVEKMLEFVPVGLPQYENSGKLRDSVAVPEQGQIVFTAPFARHDYYADVNHRNGGNPQAQRLWFEYMKTKYAQGILRGTAKIIGGKK